MSYRRSRVIKCQVASPLRGPMGACLAALAALLCLAPGDASARRPTLRTITIDGDMSDWDVVLANPTNVSVDDDAYSHRGDCSGTGDLDCPDVRLASKDISRFAWTYDAAGLYVFLERFAASSQTRSWWLAVDLTLDGLMFTDDRLVRFNITGTSTHTADVALFAYIPANGAGGDPLVSGGYGDGYTLPGRAGSSLGTRPPPVPPLYAGNAAATQFEQFVSWAELGVTAKPVGMHVGLGDDTAAINAVDDNSGGPDRKKLWTLWTELSIDEDKVASGAPSTTVDLPHVVTLEGNGDEWVNFQVTGSTPLAVEVWSDWDMDGVPDPGGRLGVDVNADGLFETIDVDGNFDGVPDDGTTHRADQAYFVVRALLPGSAVDARLDVCARAALDSTAVACAADRVVAGDLSLTPNHDRRVAPGLPLLFEHAVGNQLASNLVIELSGVSSNGWAYQYLTDPNGDGDPVDGAPITDRNANGTPDLDVAALTVVNVVARATVPVAAPLGTVETFTLTARAPSGTPQATASDRAVVAPKVELTPDYLRPGTNGYVGPGRVVLYRHVLRNNTEKDANFSITVLTGWTARLFSDPDGDGDPSDGADITTVGRLLGVPRYGGAVGLVVQIQAPGNAPIDAVDVATVTAYLESAGIPPSDSATDETIVSQLATYRDAARLEQSTRFVPCDTIRATAFGLEPSIVNGFQFTWFDDTGAPVRQTTFTSDASGRGFDEAFVPDSAQGQWQLALTRLPSTPVDSRNLDIEGGPVADLVATDKPSYLQVGEDITVSFTLRNPNLVSPLTNLFVDVVVLDPTRTRYLMAGGTFAAWSGFETTRTWSVPRIEPGATYSDLVTVPAATYETTGAHVALVRWRHGCSSLQGESERTFDVGGGGGCSGAALTEVQNVRVRKSGNDVSLVWDDMTPLEPCVTYRVWDSPRTPLPPPQPPPPWWRLDNFADFTQRASGLTATTWTDPSVLTDRLFHAYIVQASSPSEPDGPLDPWYGP